MRRLVIERAFSVLARDNGLAWIPLVLLLAVAGCDSLRLAERATETERLAAQSYRGGRRRDGQSRAEFPGACGPDPAIRVAEPGVYVLLRPAQGIPAGRDDRADSRRIELATGRHRRDRICRAAGPGKWRTRSWSSASASAALLGGVCGTRAVQFLKIARTKSQALKEIVKGNELFKQQQPSQAKAFKAAQQNQSPETRQLVAAMKG